MLSYIYLFVQTNYTLYDTTSNTMSGHIFLRVFKAPFLYFQVFQIFKVRQTDETIDEMLTKIICDWEMKKNVNEVYKLYKISHELSVQY